MIPRASAHALCFPKGFQMGVASSVASRAVLTAQSPVDKIASRRADIC